MASPSSRPVEPLCEMWAKCSLRGRTAKSQAETLRGFPHVPSGTGETLRRTCVVVLRGSGPITHVILDEGRARRIRLREPGGSSRVAAVGSETNPKREGERDENVGDEPRARRSTAAWEALRRAGRVRRLVA